MMDIRVLFAWYDFWIGVYYDRKNLVWYICPLPMIVIRISKKAPSSDNEPDLSEDFDRDFEEYYTPEHWS